jgi:hypothetical protein
LPKFGAWDVKDPNAGDGFTMIFQKLSNEKKEGGPVHIPRLNSDQPPAHEDNSYGKHQNQPGPRNNNKKQSSSSPVSIRSSMFSAIKAWLCRWLEQCSHHNEMFYEV